MNVTKARKQTIYFESMLGCLVPVEFIGYAESPAFDVTQCYNVVVKLKRDLVGSTGNVLYVKGEIVHCSPRYLVIKSYVKDYKQFVRQAQLPMRTAENTIESRW